jgi:hypothetical protein
MGKHEPSEEKNHSQIRDSPSATQLLFFLGPGRHILVDTLHHL